MNEREVGQAIAASGIPRGPEPESLTLESRGFVIPEA